MLLKSKNSVYRLSFLADYYSKMFQSTSTRGGSDAEIDDEEEDVEQ